MSMKNDFGGDLVKRARCPKCSGQVLYNGNYWCPECGWVMDEKRTPANKEIIKSYLIQRHEEARAEGNQREMDRMAEYLLDYV